MTDHRLLPIDQATRPLHKVEVAIVARTTGHGCHVRTCSCGWLLVALTELEIYAMFAEHARNAAVAKGWT